MPVHVRTCECLRPRRVLRAPRVALLRTAAAHRRGTRRLAHLVHGVRRHKHIPPRPSLQTRQRRSQVPGREPAQVHDHVPRPVHPERGTRRHVHGVRERLSLFPVADDVRHLFVRSGVTGVAAKRCDPVAAGEVVRRWKDRGVHRRVADPLAGPAVNRGDRVAVGDQRSDDVRADEAVAAEDERVPLFFKD